MALPVEYLMRVAVSAPTDSFEAGGLGPRHQVALLGVELDDPYGSTFDPYDPYEGSKSDPRNMLFFCRPEDADNYVVDQIVKVTISDP
jgi:hypothetical protein